MPSEYFGGAPTAVQGGFEFGAAQRQRKQRENALNALIERFGPEAADPVALQQLQGAQQQAQMQPYVMHGLQRADAAQQAAVDQFGPAAGDPASQEIIDRQKQTQRELQQRAGLNAATYLQATKKRGGNLEEAFNRVQGLLPALGVPAEQLSSVREQFLQDPDSVIAMLRSGDPNSSVRAVGQPTPVYDEKTGKYRLMQAMTDGTTQLIEGVQPAATLQADARIGQGYSRLALGRDNLDWNKVKEFLPSREPGIQLSQAEDGRVVANLVPGSPAEQKMETTLLEMDAGDQKLLKSYGSVSDHANVVKVNADRALQYLQSADAGILMQTLRSGASRVPGTAAYDLWDALETIKNNVGIDELQRMRQSSPTGGAMGNVSDRDMATLTGTLGRLEVARDPVRLKEDLENLLSTYSRVVGYAGQDAEKAQYRMQLRQKRGGAESQAPPSTRQSEPSIDDLLNQYAPR